MHVRAISEHFRHAHCSWAFKMHQCSLDHDKLPQTCWGGTPNRYSIVYIKCFYRSFFVRSSLKKKHFSNLVLTAAGPTTSSSRTFSWMSRRTCLSRLSSKEQPSCRFSDVGPLNAQNYLMSPHNRICLRLVSDSQLFARFQLHIAVPETITSTNPSLRV